MKTSPTVCAVSYFIVEGYSEYCDRLFAPRSPSSTLDSNFSNYTVVSSHCRDEPLLT